MTLPFAILAMLTIAGAAAALTLRNLVHCVLALTLCFTGLAGLYLELGAQFVGFAQILIYVGAIAILIVFAIFLTSGAEPISKLAAPSTWISGGVVSIAVFGLLAWTLRASLVSRHELSPRPQASVHQIGNALMSQFVLPLEVVGLLLTATLVGAVTIALRDKGEAK